VITPGEDSIVKGDFGETWLEVVASAIGMEHGRPTTTDRDKADVELKLLNPGINDWDNACVQVQVKASERVTVDNDSLVFDLDIKTYDRLRRGRSVPRRLLAVFKVSDPTDRIRLTDEGTLLVGRGAWISLEGYPASNNTDTQRIKLPLVNGVDAEGLVTMLKSYGTPESTPTGPVNLWEG